MSFGEYYAGFSGLGKSFFDGMDSARQQRERDEYKSGLKALGEAAGSGDYDAAAKAAFGLGDINSGLGLLKYKQAIAQGKASAEAWGGLPSLYGPGAGGGDAGGAQPPVGGVYGYPGTAAPGAQGGGQGASLPPLASGYGRPPIFARQDLGAGDAPASPDRSGVPVFTDMGGPSGNFLGGLFKRESGGNPNAQAPTSSARGLGQFTTGTWNATARQHPELGLTPVAPGQDGRTDANQMVRATQALTADHTGVLQGSSLPVNDASLYALHFLGANGGRFFVAGAMRNPDAPASRYASPDQVAANRNVFYRRDGTPKSAGEVMGDFGRSFGMGGSGGPAAPAPVARPVQVASTDPDFLPAQMPPNGRQTAPAPAMPMPAPFDDGAPGPGQGAAMPQPGAGAPMQVAQARPAVSPGPGGSPFPPGLSGGGRMGTIPPSSDPSAPINPQGLQAPPLLSQMGAGPAAFPGAAPVPQTPAADLPDPGSQDAGFVVPPAARAQLSAQAPQHLVQAGVPQQFAAPVANMAAGSQRRIQYLIRLGAMPGMDEGQRSTIGILLKNEVEQTNLPGEVRDFLAARGMRMTQARSPAEYAAEMAAAKQGPQVLGPGSSVFQGGRIVATAPKETDFTLSAGQGRYTMDGRPIAVQPDKDKGNDVTAEVAAREREGIRLGLQPGSPELQRYALGMKADAERQTEGEKIEGAFNAREALAARLGYQKGTAAYNAYVGSGKTGADRDLSAGEKKAITQAEDQVLQLDQSIDTLSRALQLNNQTFTGATAGTRGWVGTSIPGAGLVLDPKAAAATREFGQITSLESLKTMSQTLKGATTEREMAKFLEIMGDPTTPPDIRSNMLNRMLTLAQRQRDLAHDRFIQMRDGTYYRPGGGQAAMGGAGSSPDPRALPPPSPSNRPGAASAGDRFGQLVGSGLSKQQAYEQLHREGY